jgi:hypothetical protein
MTNPSSLALAIHARNARLRAWKGAGVRLLGGWVQRGRLLAFDLKCVPCRRWYQGEVGRDTHLPDAERSILRRSTLDVCPHLAPLLDPDPPEVVAITELELLAG